MRIAIRQCTEWSDLFHNDLNDPLDRLLRVIQYGGVILAISGFDPIARRIDCFRDYLFCTWIANDLLRGLNGDAFQWIGKKEPPSSREEVRDCCYLLQNLLYPLLVATKWQRFPLLQDTANVSWAMGSGLHLLCAERPEQQTMALVDFLYAATFFPYVNLESARPWLGVASGSFFLGIKAWPRG